MKGKGKLNITRSICLLSFLIITGTCFSQTWEQAHSDLFFRDMDITVNAGITSYFGDMSIYDQELYNKINEESGPAFGLTFTKQLGPEISFSGQLLTGRIKSRKGNVSFESSIFEYNLQIRLNLLRMISKNYMQRGNWTVYGGLGNFIFDTKKTVFNEGEETNTFHKSRVPEFVYFIGSGYSYRINEKLSIGVDLSLHQFQNDKLDNTVKNEDFDYYTFFGIGIGYHFGTIKNKSIRNKARIAHSNHQKKPLQTNR